MSLLCRLPAACTIRGAGAVFHFWDGCLWCSACGCGLYPHSRMAAALAGGADVPAAPPLQHHDFFHDGFPDHGSGQRIGTVLMYL